MDYLGALAKLLKLVDHERVTYPSDGRVRYDLSRMEALLAGLNNPHLALPTVHIAGTKGKGSTAAMCASVLTQAGYRTGLFTSPTCNFLRTNSTRRTAGRRAGICQPGGEGVAGNRIGRPQAGLGHRYHVRSTDSNGLLLLQRFSRLPGYRGGARWTIGHHQPGRSAGVCSYILEPGPHLGLGGHHISYCDRKGGHHQTCATVVTAPQVPEAMKVIESRCQDQGGKLIKVGEDLTWSVGCVEKGGQSFEVHGRLGSYDLWTPLLGDYQLENATTAVGVLEALVETGTPISDNRPHRRVQAGRMALPYGGPATTAYSGLRWGPQPTLGGQVKRLSFKVL